jgi:hypothetical protein
MPDFLIDVSSPGRVLSMFWCLADIIWHLAEFVQEVGEILWCTDDFVWLLRTDFVSVAEFIWLFVTDSLTVGGIV